jgi:hypothetical protein
VILGQPVVVQVQLARFGIDDNVLEHGAEAPRRRVDLRFGLRGETNRLCVAAAFEVEHTAIAPAVLVVADQHPFGVARQRGLARTRQAEEERRVARRADVGRAMHRQDVPQRQQVVQDREDRLLHLAGVTAAADEHEFLREIHRDHDVGVGAVALGIRLKLGESMTVNSGTCGDDALVSGMNMWRTKRLCHANSVMIRTASRHFDRRRHSVLTNNSLPASEAMNSMQDVEVRRLHRPVHLAPRDQRFARRFADGELVVRGAAGVLSGSARQRAFGRDHGLVTPDRLLIERGRGEGSIEHGPSDSSRSRARPRSTSVLIVFSNGLQRSRAVAHRAARQLLNIRRSSNIRQITVNCKHQSARIVIPL